MITGVVLLSVLILAIIGTPYISGQGILIPFGPYGRQISHYNLLQQGVSQMEFQKLSKRFSYYEEVINFFASQYAEILEEVKALKSRKAGDPVCPKAATAIGAKMVNGKCLSVEVNFKMVNDAKLQCMAQGGILAEPLFTDFNFLINLNSVFPDKVTQIGSLGMYVGIESVNWEEPFSTYIYKSNHAHIPDLDPIWFPAATPGTGPNWYAYVLSMYYVIPPPILAASALSPNDTTTTPPVSRTMVIPPRQDLPPNQSAFPPGTWKLGTEMAGLTPRGFICQYPTS